MITALAALAIAQGTDDDQGGAGEPGPVLPRVQLAEVIDAVSRSSGRTLLVHHGAPPEIIVGQPRLRDLDYAALLTILGNNDLTAVTDGDYVTVAPARTVRQYPLPMVQPDDASVEDDAWVTAVIQLENAPAATLVPILRPLLPQRGHLAAYPPSNSILIVDGFGNLKRVAGIMPGIDARTPPQEEPSRSPGPGKQKPRFESADPCDVMGVAATPMSSKPAMAGRNVGRTIPLPRWTRALCRCP